MKINEKAMLVTLIISQWAARHADLKATNEVLQANGARANSGRFNKLLVSLYSVKKYQRAVNDARTFHYANTLPWDDEGARILPSENFLAYTKKMRELQSLFQAAVDEFISDYPALIRQARADLGGLFNAADYPSSQVVRDKFQFSTHFSALPDSADFRVNLGDDEVKAIKADIEDRVNNQVKAAVEDLWGRLHRAVNHLADKLRDTDSIFRDSLVGNIKELTDVLPRLNITGDANLGQMIYEARAALANLDPSDLRENETDRKAATGKAEDILKKMAGYMGAKS